MEQDAASNNWILFGYYGSCAIFAVIVFIVCIFFDAEKKMPEVHAVYWMRGLLIFTILWESKRTHQLYNTKPCLCVTDWATTSWVDAQVEWEVIEILSQSREYGNRLGRGRHRD